MTWLITNTIEMASTEKREEEERRQEAEKKKEQLMKALAQENAELIAMQKETQEAEKKRQEREKAEEATRQAEKLELEKRQKIIEEKLALLEEMEKKQKEEAEAQARAQAQAQAQPAAIVEVRLDSNAHEEPSNEPQVEQNIVNDILHDETNCLYKVEKNILNTTREQAKVHFAKYIENGNPKQFPNSLPTTHGNMYMFQGEGECNTESDYKKMMTKAHKLDQQKWHQETKGGINVGKTIMVTTHVGKEADGKRNRQKKKYVFYDTEHNTFLVHYINLEEHNRSQGISNVPPTVDHQPIINDLPRVDAEVQIVQPDVENSVKATPFANINHILLENEVIDLFNSAKSDNNVLNKNNEKHIENPKGGEIYVFNIQNEGKGWEKKKAKDSHRWKRHPQVVNFNGQEFARTRSSCMSYNEDTKDMKVTNRFIRMEMEDRERSVGIFHYIGHEEEIKRGPHGNSYSSAPYIPSATQVADKISSVGLNVQPTALLHEDNSQMLPGTLAATHSIRDANQVKYRQQKLRDAVKMTSNQVESMIAVRNETENFVRDLRLQPIAATMMTEDMAEEMRKILENMPLEKALEVYIDTLYKMGDFYVTTIAVKHPLLERKNMSTNQLFSEPVIPIAYEIHDRRLAKDHKMFLYNVQEAVDEKYTEETLHSFKNKNLICVADGEFHDEKLWAFAKPNPNTIKTAACWNHLRMNLEFKMTQMNKTLEAKQQADRELTWLLNSQTRDIYEDRKEELRQKDHSFMSNEELRNYFDKNVDKKIQMGAIFHLQEIGLDKFEHGCTSNPAESYNQTLKRQSDNQEHAVGEQMLIFYYNQRMSAQECDLALYSRGPFELKPEYAYLSKPITEYPGKKIETVASMKKNIHDALNMEPSEDMFAEPDHAPLPRPTVEHLAQKIYENCKIEFMTEDNRILVESYPEKTTKFIVDMGTFTCTCPQGHTGSCCHIRATVRKLNMAKDFGDPKRLQKNYKGPSKAAKRRNFRDRNAKSGRKQPRAIDSVPAGTAMRPNITFALTVPVTSTTNPGSTVDASNSTMTHDSTHANVGVATSPNVEPTEIMETSFGSIGDLADISYERLLDTAVFTTDVEMATDTSGINIETGSDGVVVINFDLEAEKNKIIQERQAILDRQAQMEKEALELVENERLKQLEMQAEAQRIANLTAETEPKLDYEMRSKHWSAFSKEEKEFFENKIEQQNGIPIGFSRKPKTVKLDCKNKITTETPQLEDIYAQLTIIDKNNEECVLVKTDNDQAVLLCNKQKSADEEMMKTCADIMTTGYQVNPASRRKVFIGKKVAKSNLVEEATKLSQNVAKFEESVKKGNTTVKNPLDTTRFDQFAVYCHCNEARKSNSKTNDLIQCSGCKEKYHKECVGQKSTSFTCTSCSINTEGAKWASRPKVVTNTCPIDNTITHLAIRCEKSPKFKEEIVKLSNNPDPLIKALADSALAIEDNDSFRAQKIFANAVMNKKLENNTIAEIPKEIDFWGGTDEMLFQYVPDLGHFIAEDLEPCNTCGVQEKYNHNEIFIPLTTTPADYLEHESPLLEIQQIKCPTEGCTGERQQSALQIEPNDDPKPLFLRVHNQGALVGPEEFFKLPKEVVISNEKFQLGNIVMYDHDHKHFSSMQWVNGEFIHYDGMWKGKGKHHRMAAKSDYLAKNIVVDHVLYVRAIDGELI